RSMMARLGRPGKAAVPRSRPFRGPGQSSTPRDATPAAGRARSTSVQWNRSRDRVGGAARPRSGAWPAKGPPRGRQGFKMSGSISIVGTIPTPDDETTWLRSRVLELLARGVPRQSFDDRDDGWWHRPGALPWWEVRTRVGGRVDAATFAGVVEGLIDDGLVIEV